MYAIVDTHGRQLKVRKGETVLVDNPNLELGKEFTFDKVIFYTDEQGDIRIGKPVLDNVKVTGKVAGTASGPKLVVFKYRRRKSMQRKTGHRQKYGQVKIQDIVVS